MSALAPPAPSERSLDDPDPARAVMARALEVIGAATPAQSVGWFPVDRRGAPAGAALLRLGREIPVDPDLAWHEYVDRYHHENPFAPEHYLDSRRPLTTMAEIGGRDGLLRTGYGAELLPEYGVEFETALYVRDGDRMLGAIQVSRNVAEGDFTEDELEFLRRAQPFVEGSYVAALERAG